MRGLDTNVLLRFLIADDPIQAEAAKREVDEARKRNERLFLSIIVLCELIWTLRGKPYALNRETLSDLLGRLLGDVDFEIQDRELVQQALRDYRQGQADFADYLLGWENREAGCRDTLSFDGHLRGHEGFSMLS
jgi:predicted nucleic-acid-binding protein